MKLRTLALVVGVAGVGACAMQDTAPPAGPVAAAPAAPAQAAPAARAAPARGVIAADGSVTVPGFTLPFSAYASPEARADLLARTGTAPAAGGLSRHDTYLQNHHKRYPVTVTQTTIGGIDVQVIEPTGGVPADRKDRVLINMHGGGWTGGWPTGALIESIPIASMARTKVVAVNYRLAPAAKFPAASEDLGAVYKVLLQTYAPGKVGIFGCSAGGTLTGQGVAWIQHLGLPRPAGAVIISGTIHKLEGDSMWSTGLMGGTLPVPPTPDVDAFFAAASGGYVAKSETNNPLMWPSLSPDVLSKFPPVLFLNGTRSIDMSGMLQSHLDLLHAGGDSRLMIWDGVDHCFTYNPEMRESREAYAAMVKFFDEVMTTPKQ